MNARNRTVARLWAWGALLSALGVVVALGWLLVTDALTLAFLVVGLGVAAALGWIAVTRLGWVRGVAVVLALAALASDGVEVVVRGALNDLAGFVVAGAALAVTTRKAILSSRRRELTSAPANGSRPRQAGKAVLLMNPRSGGGKVERFELVAEAQRRGIEPVLLQPGDDLSVLAHEAARSADVIGMAGGDGSQALVAQVAMEHDVDFVCVPAGTRNHLALDLGLDRGDVVEALDAFASRRARTIDLAFVNERVFVNNVGLGVYAEVVQSDAYRDAKLGTAAKMLPELLGPSRAAPFDLRFIEPSSAKERSAQLLLVSNNPYVLSELIGVGSRPRMDTGKLGIVAVEIGGAAAAARLASLRAVRQVRRFEGWEEWTADSFQIESGSPVAAGIDGEAVVLDPPLRFTITPSALRVRLPPTAVGLSPAALRPSLNRASVRELWEIATTRAERGAEARAKHPWLRSERFLAHPDRAIWAGAALLAVFVLMAILVPAEPLALERSWAEAMNDIQTPVLKDVALVFNWLGRGIGRALSIVAIGVVLLVARRWLALLAFAVTESVTPLISSLTKALVGRTRPPDGLVHPAGASFPSGHAAYAGATCIALVLLFTAASPRRRVWWTIAALGIAAMAWSRTYLQVHWLADVIGGSLLGIGIAFLAFGGAQRWASRANRDDE